MSFVKNKADVERVINIETSLEDYTLKAEFDELLNSIPEYAKMEKLMTVSTRIDELEDNLKFVAKQDIVLKRINDLRNSFVRQLNMKIDFDKFEKCKNEIGDRFEKQTKDIFEQQKTLVNFEK